MDSWGSQQYLREQGSRIWFQCKANPLQIATPGHDLYGSHMSQHIIDSMIAPKDESKDLVMQWLESKGMSSEASLSPRSDSIIIETTVDKVEKLLNAEYNVFGKTYQLLSSFFLVLTHKQFTPALEMPF
jgi:subtilase family serine protease